MAKKKKKRKVLLLFPVFIFFILVVVLISTVFEDLLVVRRNIKQTSELKERYNLLKEEEESLNVEIAKLQDPDYIARYAREKYMYSKEGEVILRIIDKEEFVEPEEEKK